MDNFYNIVQVKSLPTHNVSCIIAGNSKWLDTWKVSNIIDLPIGSGSEVIMSPILGETIFNYSRTKILTKIQVTSNAQLSLDHYKAHNWEDYSKQSPEFIFYNLYAVDVNPKNQYEKSANNPNIASLKKGRSICGSNPNAMCCAQGTTTHKLNFKLDKNQVYSFTLRLISNIAIMLMG